MRAVWQVGSKHSDSISKRQACIRFRGCTVTGITMYQADTGSVLRARPTLQKEQQGLDSKPCRIGKLEMSSLHAEGSVALNKAHRAFF